MAIRQREAVVLALVGVAVLVAVVAFITLDLDNAGGAAESSQFRMDVSGQVGPAGGPVAASDGGLLVTSDDSNVAAALALSQASFPAGTAQQVVLARSDLFADALASAGLQAAVEGPLLLSDSGELSPGVLDELVRLGAERVHLLGDVQALSGRLEQDLQAADFEVRRWAGTSRADTAVRIAQGALPAAEGAVLVRGFEDAEDATRGFADALAAGAWAAAEGWPVLLSDVDQVPTQTLAYLQRADVERVAVVGGESAVSARVMRQLETAGVEVERLAGDSRAATAAEVAQRMMPVGDRGRAVLVDGREPGAWAPGFAAASYARRTGSPLLLVEDGQVPPSTAELLADIAATPLCTPGVSEAVCTEAASLGPS